MPSFNATLKINAKDTNKAGQVCKDLEVIIKNLNAESIAIIAEKSKTIGINAKVKAFKHLL